MKDEQHAQAGILSDERRKLNQLIWAAAVLPIGRFIMFAFGSFGLFVWRLALLWGGVAKYGVLALLQLQ